MDKKSFILYCNNAEQVALLSDEEAGKVFKALFIYAEGGDVPTLPPVAKMAFSFITRQIRRDTEAWLQVRAKRSEAGKLGGAPKGNCNASKNKQKQTEKPKTKKTVKSDRIIRQALVDKYNSICYSLPKVQKLTEQREGAINARLSEYNISDVENVFRKAEASDFLSGRKKDWHADFDWLMKPNNFIKVIEGVYDGKADNMPTVLPSEDIMLQDTTFVPQWNEDKK